MSYYKHIKVHGVTSVSILEQSKHTHNTRSFPFTKTLRVISHNAFLHAFRRSRHARV